MPDHNEFVEIPFGFPPNQPPARGIYRFARASIPYLATAAVGAAFVASSGIGLPLVAAKAGSLKTVLGSKALVAKSAAWLNGHSILAGGVKVILVTAGCYATGEVVTVLVDGAVITIFGMTASVVASFAKLAGRDVTWGEIGILAVEAIRAAAGTIATAHIADFMVVFGPTAVGAGVVAYVVLKTAWEALWTDQPAQLPGVPPVNTPYNGPIGRPSSTRPLRGVPVIIERIDIEILEKRAKVLILN